MIRGLGIDLCEVCRMEAALAKGGFLERFFTPEEQAYILSRGKGAAQSMAGHFAAKEAALKVLGCGLAFSLTDIAVTHNDQGAPSYKITGKMGDFFASLGGGTLLLSITHTDEMAAAVAVWEG